MIFDNYCEGSVVGPVEESKYPLGLEGALMHVYENECNYNAMMKAVGISELRYFKETGDDLFLCEASAVGGFLTKVKEFFKKVLEKIKAMFKKLWMVISAAVGNDKEFVKKYEKQLLRVNLTDFEFEGYTFEGLKDIKCALDKAIAKTNVETYLDKMGYSGKNSSMDTLNIGIKDADELEDKKEELRAYLADDSGIKSASSKLTEAELREEYHDYIFGDKETLDNINMRDQLEYIKNAKTNVESLQAAQNKAEQVINKTIKAIDKAISDMTKTVAGKSDDEIKNENEKIKQLNYSIDLAKSVLNDYTIMSGIDIDGVKSRNRQAKAICIKAINYKPKNESATLVDDVFAGVEII